ncbi:MAG TPA: efflux RND transporter permease subunit [Caldithrix abyssi]|uniref:Efflux RND transporter permease subunit n=1 Tax=Caldithrix abyssi TaxID=187145 RepID=A0A7V4U1H3_CALAY|nr:efflux RND transporter permease subunit [Caldithrix abyssi]
MINKIIEFAARQRLLILIFTILIVAAGFISLNKLPIDAFPDVSPVLVQVFTEAPGLAPEEVEKLITYPIEVAMNGLPDIREVKSVSTFGLSVVSVYFEDNVDIYFARQLVFERLQSAKGEIPEGLGDPELGPITSGLGQVYQYYLQGEGYSLMELREIQDWVVKFQLRTVPGVTEILSFGGEVKQYQIQLDPILMQKYDITLDEILAVVKSNNRNVGGNFIVRDSEEYLIRGLGWVSSLKDIENIKVVRRNGIPVFIRDIAKVVYGPEIRRGLVSMNNKGEIVSGIVLKLLGENTSEVINNIKKKVEQINASLPKGVKVVPYYDQADLVKKATDTVKDALLEGGILVIIILLLFLGNVRSALIVTLTLPLSALLAFILMNYFGMSANLMSLGGLAIGIGMMVDGSIVMVENIIRHLSEDNSDESKTIPTILQAAREVGRPIVFAISIIIIVFLPLFTLQEVEGKLFSPMAFTISFAMLGSLIFSLTLVPVLCTYFFRKGIKEKPNFIVNFLQSTYVPLLEKVINHRVKVAVTALLLLLGSLLLIPFLGTEFVPILDEGTLAVRITLSPSTSLQQAAEISAAMEPRLMEFPEVVDVISRVGRAEVGGDPEPVNNSEIYVILKPEEEWSTVENKAELVEKMRQKLNEFPGILFNFTQPIQMRVDELLSGVKAQLAIKLFGDDLDVLAKKGAEIQAVVSDIPGAADIQMEQIAGKPQIQIKVNRDRIARLGMNVDEVQEVIETAIGGSTVGQVFQGQKRFDIFIRFNETYRDNLDKIRNTLISTPDGGRIPLVQVADISLIVGPKQISRDNSQRRISIQCNVEGRDMGSFVAETQKNIAQKISLPPGYYVTFGGQFENQQRAMARLALIVPLTILLIFVMLFSTFNSVRNAFLIILNVPFAVIGGILALFFSGLYLSVPASVGFIALFGVAVLNGVVMVSYFNQLRNEGLSLHDAIITGSKLRLRPVLMTALVASLGLIPLLFSSGTGSEVQRPLATVVIGGLVSSTFLTLFVLPTLYAWFEKKRVEF